MGLLDIRSILGGVRAKRVFTSFAIEDRNLRDLLVGQAKNSRIPFEFTDMSVKQPWDAAWKTNCRTRIKGCDGVIGIVTRNTPKAEGQLWEVKCAYEEGVPVLLIYGGDARPVLAGPLAGRRVLTWSWANIEAFVERI
jgi:hypothetical protein